MENLKEKEEVKDKKNLLEWAVFWLGLALLLSIFTYLGYQVYNHKPSPPEILVEYWPEPSEAQPNRYRVAVRNTGGETAESVLVELVLEQDGEEVEKAELQLNFVPQESKREGWVNFSQKPAAGATVSARVASYQKP